MKLEEINNRTKDAVSYLVEALGSRGRGGRSSRIE